MIIAATDWLAISINLLLVLFVLVCLLMVLLIFMQRPKQEGLGAAFGAGVTDQVFGAQTTNVLQKGTVYLATAFFILSLTLAVLIGYKNNQISLIDKKTAPAPVAAKTPEPPAQPLNNPIPSEAAPAPAPTESPASPAAPASEETPAPSPTPAESPAPAPTEATTPTPTPSPTPAPAGQ